MYFDCWLLVSNFDAARSSNSSEKQELIISTEVVAHHSVTFRLCKLDMRFIRHPQIVNIDLNCSIISAKCRRTGKSVGFNDWTISIFKEWKSRSLCKTQSKKVQISSFFCWFRTGLKRDQRYQDLTLSLNLFLQNVCVQQPHSNYFYNTINNTQTKQQKPAKSRTIVSNNSVDMKIFKWTIDYLNLQQILP